MKVQLDITQEDINTGVRHNCVNCPIAKAACRALGLRVFVSSTGIDLFKD